MVSPRIRIAVVGDLLLTARPGSSSPGRGLEAISNEIRNLFSACDQVIANLECTLPADSKVPTEPRLFTTKEQIETLTSAGISIVSLGNNHTFDALDEGFYRLTGLLENSGIRWFGAGRNLAQALEPAVMEKQGIKLAVIGLVDPSSGMKRFAAAESSGVACLDLKSAARTITELKKQAPF
ncbi:MAG: CapA family protein [Desulfobia sp.]